MNEKLVFCLWKTSNWNNFFEMKFSKTDFIFGNISDISLQYGQKAKWIRGNRGTYQCNNTVDGFVEAIDKICHSLIAGSVNVIEVNLLECGWNGWQLIAYEFNCIDNVNAIVMLILSMSNLQWPGKCDGIGGASWRAQHQVFDLRCCHIFPLPAVRQKVNGIRNTKTTSRCCFMLRNCCSSSSSYNCCYCFI